MFYDTFLQLCNSVNKSPSAVVVELGMNKSAVTNWKQRKTPPRDATLRKLADYFGVSVEYLLNGEDTKKDPDHKVEVSEDDIKVALFGGDGDVTAEQWDEVKRFAEFVKLRDSNRSDGKSVQDSGKE